MCSASTSMCRSPSQAVAKPWSHTRRSRGPQREAMSEARSVRSSTSTVPRARSVASGLAKQAPRSSARPCGTRLTLSPTNANQTGRRPHAVYTGVASNEASTGTATREIGARRRPGCCGRVSRSGSVATRSSRSPAWVRHGCGGALGALTVRATRPDRSCRERSARTPHDGGGRPHASGGEHEGACKGADGCWEFGAGHHDDGCGHASRALPLVRRRPSRSQRRRWGRGPRRSVGRRA